MSDIDAMFEKANTKTMIRLHPNEDSSEDTDNNDEELFFVKKKKIDTQPVSYRAKLDQQIDAVLSRERKEDSSSEEESKFDLFVQDSLQRIDSDASLELNDEIFETIVHIDSKLLGTAMHGVTNAAGVSIRMAFYRHYDSRKTCSITDAKLSKDVSVALEFWDANNVHFEFYIDLAWLSIVFDFFIFCHFSSHVREHLLGSAEKIVSKQECANILQSKRKSIKALEQRYSELRRNLVSVFQLEGEAFDLQKTLREFYSDREVVVVAQRKKSAATEYD